MSRRRPAVVLRVLAAALALALVGIGCRGARTDPASTSGPVSGVPADAGAAAIYASICQGCHMADGRGAEGAGSYPALAGNPALASPAFVAVTILNGRRNMPAFARPDGQDFFFAPVWLSDQQVADLVNYLRSGFGNTWTDEIGADEVRALHP